MSANQHKVGQLSVWWIPQVLVDSIEQGVKVLDVLGDYDLFQHEHNIKGDYCNVGGLRQWCEDSDGNGTPGWEDWHDPDPDYDGEDDPKAYLIRVKEGT